MRGVRGRDTMLPPAKAMPGRLFEWQASVLPRGEPAQQVDHPV